MLKRDWIVFAVLFFAIGCSSTAIAAGAKWNDPKNKATLKNDALEATFQSGIPVQIKDLSRNKLLLNVDPSSMPGAYPFFGPSGIELSSLSVEQDVTENRISTRLKSAGGDEITFRWTIEPGRGDLIAEMSAQSAKPVEELRMILLGCDIGDHSIVGVDGYGVGRPQRAPWDGSTVGNPLTAGSPGGYMHPLVALFQGQGAGWWVEGRDERIGPSSLMMKGEGATAVLGYSRRFPVPTTTPQLYQIRVRAYREHWQDAVDPYIEWMEKDVGYIPLEKQEPKWVRDITNQAYIRIGDFDTLENLAKQVDPQRTLLGRMVGAWIHPMDYGYPDYTLNETAKKWIGRARELGFHVGVHFNTFGISKNRTDLLERFKKGLLVVGKDDRGNDLYQAVDGANRHAYCSPALKEWREYFIQQIKPAIDAGVDVVYLDESMAAMGQPLIDGMTSIEGVMTLEKEIKQAYPHVAIETEQFNTMSSRYSSFALSQMPLGHPLGGYIFHRFVNVVAEGVMGQPTDAQLIDSFASWGFMLPCANSRDDSWLHIAQAFQKHNLKPDSRMPRQEISAYEGHLSHGLMPRLETNDPSNGIKLFGYRGTGNVTAYFETHGNRRGLVVYEPGKEPLWVGTRVSGVSTWAGPGVLRDIIPGSEVMVDWMIYAGSTQLALNPNRSYVLDETGSLDPDRFHVTGVPSDFAFYSDGVKRIESQYTGPKKDWFKLNFSGHGEMSLRVPETFLVFLDGQEISVDRANRSARFVVDAAPEKPSTLLAFAPSPTELSGPWVDLPWHTPPAQRSWYVLRHVFDDVSADGPVRMIKPGNGFWSHVGGTAMILGTLPAAKKVRLQGGFAMRQEAQFEPGDAVIRLNGKQVMRLPGGARPYQMHSFDVDVTDFAGKPVFLEFTIEGNVNGAAMADWFAPQIIVDR